jgi:hypothetical protein
MSDPAQQQLTKIVKESAKVSSSYMGKSGGGGGPGRISTRRVCVCRPVRPFCSSLNNLLASLFSLCVDYAKSTCWISTAMKGISLIRYICNAAQIM